MTSYPIQGALVVRTRSRARDGRCGFRAETLEGRVLLAAGALDLSFTQTGKASVSFGPGVTARALAAAVQRDGKTVVVGNVSGGIGALVRFNLDGSLDLTFGPDRTGKIFTPFFEGTADDVGIDADGRIVVVGSASIEDDERFAVARYNSDGTLDRSFDGDGVKVFYFGADASDDRWSTASSVAFQSDGKILIGGSSLQVNGNNLSRDFAFARLNPDGSFDSSFDGDGKRTIDLGNGEDLSEIAIDYTGTAAANPNYSN